MGFNNNLGLNSNPGLGQLPPVRVAPRQPQSKQQVLVWSDSVTATTGFGTVSKHILKALYQTGRYEIDQLAINYFGDFLDRNVVPYSLVPARMGDPKDPYGNQMFLDALAKKQYDLVFIINDTFVVESIAQKLPELRNLKQTHNHKPFKLIYYYPVDCRFMPRAQTMVRDADRAVAYTEYAKRETLKLLPNHNLDVIYHGTDINSFHPLSPQERAFARKRFFNVEDDNTFILLNLNRNNIRKDMARTILAFKEFRKAVPNSLLYLHTRIVDSPGHGQEIDLGVPVEEFGFNMTKDVIFPNNLHPAQGFPIEVLNLIYNAADAYITTTLGEGWGLTITEAMAAGTPVIVPDNTSLPEIVGSDLFRGYMYPCKEQVYIDNSGFRPIGRTEDIIASMLNCYSDWQQKHPRRQQIIDKAKAFTQQYSWDNVCKSWVTLFDEVASTPIQVKSQGEVL